jgi:osmotically-inducible protein OsmY
MEGRTMASAVEMDVASRVRSTLAHSPIYVLREIHVEKDGDALLLQGKVDTFYHKQLAQEVVRSVADGMRVVNALLVD